MAKSHSQAKVQSGSKVTVVSIPDVLPANDIPPFTENQKLSANIIDFLRGIEREEWTMQTYGVAGVFLETTGDPFSFHRQRKMVTELVRLGWARPKGSKSFSGYTLVMPAKDILQKMGF
jgi:hypothetical protein